MWGIRTMLCLVIAAQVTLPSARAEEESSSSEARRARIEAMTPEELEELRRRKERFDKFDPEKQQRMRQLHEEISKDPQADELRQIMGRYNVWLGTLTAVQRAELRALEPKQRIERVRAIFAEQPPPDDFRPNGGSSSRFRRPSMEEMRRLFAWIGRYVERHEQELLRALPAEHRKDLQKKQESRYYRSWLFYRWLRTASRGTTLQFNPQELGELAELLPERAQRDIGAKTSLAEKADVARRWTRGMLGIYFWQRERAKIVSSVSRETLQKFMANELTEEKRQELMRHNPDVMRRVLTEMYLKKHGGDRWRHGNSHLRGHTRPTPRGHGEPPQGKSPRGNGPRPPSPHPPGPHPPGPKPDHR